MAGGPGLLAGPARPRRGAARGRRERLTILGGLSLGVLTACLAVEGAADTAVAVTFLRHALVPTLRPGQTVGLDDLSVHRAARWHAALAQVVDATPPRDAAGYFRHAGHAVQ